MEAIASLQPFIKVLAEFGIPGLVICMWWYDIRAMRKSNESHRAEIAAILAQYQSDMAEQRRMYEANAELVRQYEGLAKDLKDVIMLNTQAFTRLDDDIRSNQFCPAVRLEKQAPGVIGP